MVYAKHVSKKSKPQTEALDDRQVENSAGGYSYPVDCWARLDRFLVLGSDSGSYYATPRKLTQENAQCILDCAQADLTRTLETISKISTEGRAPKNSPAIFALSLLMAEPQYSSTVVNYVNSVCRTGTHIFEFAANCDELRGWGATLKNSITNWYAGQDAERLAYQVTKYKKRAGWSHRDLLRKARPNPNTLSENHAEVLRYAVTGEFQGGGIISAVEAAKTASESEIVNLIRKEGLVREHIPTEHLNSQRVWEALLQDMPMTAMMRNLGKMSCIGLTSQFSSASQMVCERLNNENLLKRARIHPYNVLVALTTYASGHGVKGSLTWNPDQQILAALEGAFYSSFQFVEPTNKRFYLAYDVSGSMTWSNIAGTHITPRDGAAAMGMVTVRSEPMCYTAAFSTGMQKVNLNASHNLGSAIKVINGCVARGTDCSLPMIDALEKKIPVDCFVVYTDSETYAGRVHPTVALNEYRNKMGIPAKLVVVGMVSNGFSIADPNDVGSLDIVGFDSSAPSVISDFCR